jgi:hypothetical protein
VIDNERLYSRAEIAGAIAGRHLQTVYSGTLVKILCAMIKAGLIIGPHHANVTVEDIHRANRIYGPPVQNIRGSTTRKTPPPPPIRLDAPPIPRLVVGIFLVAHVDIMFVEGIPFLIAVFAPLMYLMVLHLMSRQMPVVKTALMKMIGHVKKYGYAVAELLTDGEGAVMALESDLNNLGINLNGTARESVPLVESFIRPVKNRVRGIISVSPFSLSLLCLVWLVYASKHLINLTPSRSTSEFVSSEELLTGRRPVALALAHLSMLRHTNAMTS